ncbi:MAG: DUF3263 domain-containing protein [Acidimicrobiales bacterium]
MNPTPGSGNLYPMSLSERERSILDFERTWWTQPGPKAEAIRARFDLSSTRYYELLGRLLDSPHAVAYDPLVVRRLRRHRARRRRARYEGPAVGGRPVR